MIIKDLSKLREKSLNASKDEVANIISLLEDELHKANKIDIHGIGLSAPQIGINKKVAIVRAADMKINLVNCSIDSGLDLITFTEGCLSIPGKSLNIKRYNEVLIRDNEFGNINNFVSYGIIASCIQHEIDHWHGVLITDKEIKEINIGDNEMCPCGSKIKYKKCCKRKVI